MSTEVGVAAEDGVITLTGMVRSYSEKLAAERSAERVFGVKAIANDLMVHPFMKVTDSDIALNATKALAARVNVPKDKVKVVVKDGLVHLRGTVDWKYQKDAAAAAVAHLFGIKDVYNEITVQPLVSNTDVGEEIKAAFRRNADVDARRITVTSYDSTVDLWGNVHTWTEKREAERAAWAAPGVTDVHSHLRITP